MKKYLTEYVDWVNGRLVTMTSVDIYAISWESAEQALAALDMAHTTIVGESVECCAEDGTTLPNEYFFNFPICFS